MKLADYFEKVKGYGVFATADSEGKVNVAALSRPTVMEDGTVAFIMSGHLTHHIPMRRTTSSKREEILEANGSI